MLLYQSRSKENKRKQTKYFFIKVGQNMNKSLNESIIDIRVKLQKAKLKKSGKNDFAKFDYFELADFLPKLNELMQEEKINDRFYIKDDYAILELIKGDERQEYKIPFTQFETPLNKQGQPSMQEIQYFGALNTYYKRYLYLNCWGITDGEVIDRMNNEDLAAEPRKEKKASPGQVSVLNKLSEEDKEKVYTKYNVNSIEELSIKQASEIIGKLKGNK